MSAVDNKSDTIAVTVTPTQARQIATAIRLDLTARWERNWLHPLAQREEVSAARSLLDASTDELEMLEWGEPAGEVHLRSDRRRLRELAQNLLEGGEECLATREDDSTEPPDIRRQGVDMIAAAQAIQLALAHA